MVIISLLDLPLELPSDAPARQYGLETFTSGLPEYLSRCEKLYLHIMADRANDDHLQARHSREGCREVLVRKRTEPMHSVLWRVFAFWALLKRLFQGKMKINGHTYMSPLVTKALSGIWTFPCFCPGSPLVNMPLKEDLRGGPTN